MCNNKEDYYPVMIPTQAVKSFVLLFLCLIISCREIWHTEYADTNNWRKWAKVPIFATLAHLWIIITLVFRQLSYVTV